MTDVDTVFPLPDNLPVPVDDGAAAHLFGARVPSITLPATDGSPVDLSPLPGHTVVYCYPRTGQPGVPLLPGWDEIPGARGCTPQSRSYRDQYEEIRALGARVFGLSTQDTDYQRELVERLRLPFPILSDADLRFTHALNLPTFEIEGMTLLKRLTMIIRDGTIEDVFYPVFPPDRDAAHVVGWLRAGDQQS